MWAILCVIKHKRSVVSRLNSFVGAPFNCARPADHASVGSHRRAEGAGGVRACAGKIFWGRLSPRVAHELGRGYFFWGCIY